MGIVINMAKFKLQELFNSKYPVIGVIHLLPLPGSPNWTGNLTNVIERAEQEAIALETGGANGIIVENFFDTPFTKNRVDTATISALTLVVSKLNEICKIPVGLNVLRNDAISALAIAYVTGIKFIRVNVLSGVMATDQGIIESCAYDLHMYKRQLMSRNDAADIKIFADVMVKHASPMGTHSDLLFSAKDTVERGLADAIIISGKATGDSANLDDAKLLHETLPDIPLLLGSGVSEENIRNFKEFTNGIIVASSLKRYGKLENPVDADRVRKLVGLAKIRE